MLSLNTGEHVLVSHARFRACRERRLQIVAELRRQACDDMSGAVQVMVGVVEPDEPEHQDACLSVRGLRLVRDSVPVQET